MKKEIIELIKKCKTKEEIQEVLKKNNVQISESDLEKINGGGTADIIKNIFNNGK